MPSQSSSQRSNIWNTYIIPIISTFANLKHLWISFLFLLLRVCFSSMIAPVAACFLFILAACILIPAWIQPNGVFRRCLDRCMSVSPSQSVSPFPPVCIFRHCLDRCVCVCVHIKLSSEVVSTGLCVSAYQAAFPPCLHRSYPHVCVCACVLCVFVIVCMRVFCVMNFDNLNQSLYTMPKTFSSMHTHTHTHIHTHTQTHQTHTRTYALTRHITHTHTHNHSHNHSLSLTHKGVASIKEKMKVKRGRRWRWQTLRIPREVCVCVLRARVRRMCVFVCLSVSLYLSACAWETEINGERLRGMNTQPWLSRATICVWYMYICVCLCVLNIPSLCMHYGRGSLQVE